jgi:phosphatidylglycerol:prolipoprotein diacylglycerol transferase
MFTWLHTFHPQPILWSAGPITIHWYGLFMVVSMLVALTITFYLNRLYQINKDQLFDLGFWLIIWGLVGARLYDVCLQLPYYLQHPWQILAVWQGGLAIHGGIIAGILVLIYFAYRHQLNFWRLSSVLVPGVALAQTIGRWGNYFNQEIFGFPSNLPWSIPIDLINRPAAYANITYFQPTFLYESLGCLIIGLILVASNLLAKKHQKLNTSFYIGSTTLYVILYSILRFYLEFIRLDDTPQLAGLRWPQIMSLILILLTGLILFKQHVYRQKN